MNRVSSGLCCNNLVLHTVCSVDVQSAIMDVIKADHNKTAVINVTPVQHVSQFRKYTFCVEGGLLWCKMWDVPVYHDLPSTPIAYCGNTKKI